MTVKMPPVAEQLPVLTRGATDLISGEELESKLTRALDSRRPLTVKVGFDPTAADIHLGHTVLMRKMRDFQRMGHRIVYVIGDFTAAIGDPSGRSKARPPLSREEIARNAETYTEQAFKILDRDATETRFNSEWLEGLGARGLIQLAGRYTVARMLERRDFRTRYEEGIPISVHEFLYPLAQAYDSVALEADVELGGADQLFNLNVGRDLMPHYGQAPQVVMTVPLLEGTDGTQKMSKSSGNYVGIAEPPEEIYGKVMSISDELMYRWYALLTEEGEEGAIRRRSSAEGGSSHPRDLKRALARQIVAELHGDADSDAAEAHFDTVFAKKDLPDEIETTVVRAAADSISLADLLKESGLATSKGEARRLVRGGGVKVDGERATDEAADLAVPREALLQVGKRRFLRVILERG